MQALVLHVSISWTLLAVLMHLGFSLGRRDHSRVDMWRRFRGLGEKICRCTGERLILGNLKATLVAEVLSLHANRSSAIN